MQRNTVKEALSANRSVFGTSLANLFECELPVLLHAAGLDFFFIDTEHSPAEYHQIENLCRSARGTGIVPLVRVTENEPYLITRALDVGAMGVIVPRVNSPREASTAIDFMKYPPLGHRGFGMRSIMTDFRWTGAVQEMLSANKEVLTVLQIESTEALSCVDEIAATRDLDVLFIGPYDLTISMGIAEQFGHRCFWDAVDRVIEACDKRRIAAGIQSPDIELLRECGRRGMRFLLYSNDMTVLYDGYTTAIRELRGS